MRVLTFVIACLLVTTLLSSTNGQMPTAQVDITCTPEEVFLDSFPNSPNNTTVVNCVLSNPTSSEEKVEFSGSGDNVFEIDLIDGDEFIIPAGDSVSANVSVSVAEGTNHATYSLNFTAVVTEMNGVPPQNIAEESINVLGTVNQYESYDASYDSPLSFTVVLSDQTLNVWDAITVSNNGNHESMISLDVSDLNNDLGDYNLSTTVPVVTRLISSGSTDEFLLGVGVVEFGNLNTSSWELVGENGTKRLNITSSIGLQSSANATCYECTTLLDVNIEIYAIQSLVEDSDSENEDAEDENEQVPFIGFTGTLAVLTLAFALSKREI
ncbi:MAG: hypothetical protein H2065_05695 [Candidatus Poseidoniales archaeon]|nr:hypothetical protein [Candidatus Poseidoniales archaeon]